jgi:hypothetical protein
MDGSFKKWMEVLEKQENCEIYSDGKSILGRRRDCSFSMGRRTELLYAFIIHSLKKENRGCFGGAQDCSFPIPVYKICSAN